jgi:excisionase family DNA binding protein
MLAVDCAILLFMTEEWLTQEEAAKRLHVALDTMRRWVREGLFPRTKVGKRYLIPAKALEDFLQSRLQTGARPVTPRKKTKVEEELKIEEGHGEEGIIVAKPGRGTLRRRA